MAYTLEEIGRLAGVSRSTVSRVINNQPNVSDDVREQVLEVIRQTGYQPNAMARSLATSRSQIIGVIIPEEVSSVLTTPFFARLLSSISKSCNAHNYHLVLNLFGGPKKKDSLYRRVVGPGHLDGVIIASAPRGDPIITTLLRDQFPFVQIGPNDDPQVTCVDVDNLSGARMAVEHLARLGHRRIAHITGLMDRGSAQDRMAGYRAALQDHGLEVDDSLIAKGDYTEVSALTAMRRLLSAKPTAVFAASDAMAVGAMSIIRDAGLLVPQDIAVVGFDDIPMASIVKPALTTIRQPIEDLGTTAFALLLDILEGGIPKDKPAKKIVLHTQLVIRDSCGAMG